MCNHETTTQPMAEHNPKLDEAKDKKVAKCDSCRAKDVVLGLAEKVIADMAHTLKTLDNESTVAKEKVEVLTESLRREREVANEMRWKATTHLHDADRLNKELDVEKRRREADTFSLREEVKELERVLFGRTVLMWASLGFAVSSIVGMLKAIR